jgi:hypothetical protein
VGRGNFVQYGIESSCTKCTNEATLESFSNINLLKVVAHCMPLAHVAFPQTIFWVDVERKGYKYKRIPTSLNHMAREKSLLNWVYDCCLSIHRIGFFCIMSRIAIGSVVYYLLKSMKESTWEFLVHGRRIHHSNLWFAKFFWPKFNKCLRTCT